MDIPAFWQSWKPSLACRRVSIATKQLPLYLIFLTSQSADLLKNGVLLDDASNYTSPAQQYSVVSFHKICKNFVKDLSRSKSSLRRSRSAQRRQIQCLQTHKRRRIILIVAQKHWAIKVAQKNKIKENVCKENTTEK